MTEHMPVHEINMKSRAEEFVKENLVEHVNNQADACGDGRYFKDQSKGAERIFGGTFGYLLALDAAAQQAGNHIDPEQSVSKLYNALREIRGEDVKLHYHDHCGFAAQSSNPENDGKYGVSAQRAKALFEVFAAHPASQIEYLQGEHEEQGVIIVNDPKISVDSRNNENQYFVVDRARIARTMEDLVPRFSDGLPNPISVDSAMSNWDKQTRVTAGILAAGKPQFEVSLNPTGNLNIVALGPVSKAS